MATAKRELIFFVFFTSVPKRCFFEVSFDFSVNKKKGVAPAWGALDEGFSMYTCFGFQIAARF